jgi:hypothetical protein
LNGFLPSRASSLPTQKTPTQRARLQSDGQTVSLFLVNGDGRGNRDDRRFHRVPFKNVKTERWIMTRELPVTGLKVTLAAEARANARVRT